MAYPTDLTDRQWRILEPVLGVGGSRGPQPVLDRRRVVNAILYQARTGCQWRFLPTEFGPWNTIWKTFARWRDRFVCQRCEHTAHADVNAAENIAARGQLAHSAW